MLEDRPGASLRGGRVVWRVGQAPAVPSGRQWKGLQSSEGATELGFPRPALWQMQGEPARRAGEPSGVGEEASRVLWVHLVGAERVQSGGDHSQARNFRGNLLR